MGGATILTMTQQLTLGQSTSAILFTAASTMASQQPSQAATPSGMTAQQQAPPEQQNQPHQRAPNGVGGGRGGRGRGRGGRGRQQGGGGGRGSHHGGGRNSNGPSKIAPQSGIPYGHIPAFLPGSSSLVEELDKRVLIVLRDGRHLVGTLRTFDQFSNMVLEETSERKVFRDATDGTVYYSDLEMGVYVVRGDSMVLLGQVAPDDGMKKLEPQELEEMIKASNKEGLGWDFDIDLLA